MKTSFYLRGKKLYYRVSHSPFIYRALVPINFNSSQWNGKVQLFTTDSEANKKLLDFKNHLESELCTIINSGLPLKSESVKEIEIEYFTPTQKEYYLTEFLELFKQKYKKRNDLLAIQGLQKMIKPLPIVAISQIDYKWMLSFKEYLIENRYSPSMVNKNIGTIKRMLKHANRLDLPTKMSALSIESMANHIISHSLTDKELTMVFEATLPTSSLQNIQRLFLISCTTALRVSDLMSYAANPDKYISEDKEYIQMTAKKTKQPLLIPIDPRIRPFLTDVRPLSIDKYNRYLKKVMRLCGIDSEVEGYITQKDSEGEFRRVFGKYKKYQCISSHTGRRTFSTLMYSKLPTAVIRSITGHTTEASFLKYVNKPQSDYALQMKQYYESLKR